MYRSIAAILSLAVFCIPSLAEEFAVADAKAECSAKECAGKACSSEACPIETAMTKLPKLTYLVGEEKLCCADAAAKLAKDHSTHVTYVVGKQNFDEESNAMVALADATEQFVTSFTEPCHCDVSGKYTVAGKELCCEVMAGERAEVAKKAMKGIELTYLVGDKSCDCPVEAEKLANKTGVDKVFLIDDEKTCCSVDARVKLARAKYLAAVQALAKLDAATATENTSDDS